jgi:hypothetical protein
MYRLGNALGYGDGVDYLPLGFVAVLVWQCLTVWVPRRSLSDLLAGTYLVPR